MLHLLLVTLSLMTETARQISVNEGRLTRVVGVVTVEDVVLHEEEDVKENAYQAEAKLGKVVHDSCPVVCEKIAWVSLWDLFIKTLNLP